MGVIIDQFEVIVTEEEPRAVGDVPRPRQATGVTPRDIVDVVRHDQERARRVEAD